MDGELDSGLLNIALSDSEDSSSSKPKDVQSRAEKTAQSEVDFQAIKNSYRPKIENGEISKTIKLPLGASMHKLEGQDVVHAVEELYFFKRYDEAAKLVRAVFVGESGTEGLDEDSRVLLRVYEGKCLEKMAKSVKE